MTQSEIDKLTDELIDARADLTDLEGRYADLRDVCKSNQIAYCELAMAIGCGDPLDVHTDVLQRAKELARFARVA